MLDASEQSIQGGAGNLFVRAWRPTGVPRAIVAICHGFNSHSGAYAWCADQFAQHDFATYAVDLRGRGRSDGERFYIERFDDYVDDLSGLIQFAKSGESGLPIFVLGHSAGGVIACLYALEHQSEIVGLICEDIAYEVPAPDVALTLMKGISHFVPHAHALALKNEDFSRDSTFVDAMNHDPLIARETQPFATMAAIVRADELLKASFPRITLPLLVIHGTADRAAKASGSQRLHEQAGSKDKTLRLYEGRYHDPLNDFGKEEVLADIVAWIDSRVPARPYIPQPVVCRAP
jgi:acylglycerol lipase